MELSEILKRQARYVRYSGYKIEINSIFSWVGIIERESNKTLVFLEGEEANSFINKVNQLWKETGNLDKEVIAEALAKPYIEV